MSSAASKTRSLAIQRLLDQGHRAVSHDSDDAAVVDGEDESLQPDRARRIILIGVDAFVQHEQARRLPLDDEQKTMPSVGQAVDDIGWKASRVEQASEMVEMRHLATDHGAVRPDALLVNDGIEAARQLDRRLLLEAPEIPGTNRPSPLELVPGERFAGVEQVAAGIG